MIRYNVVAALIVTFAIGLAVGASTRAHDETARDETDYFKATPECRYDVLPHRTINILPSTSLIGVSDLARRPVGTVHIEFECYVVLPSPSMDTLHRWTMRATGIWLKTVDGANVPSVTVTIRNNRFFSMLMQTEGDAWR